MKTRDLTPVVKTVRVPTDPGTAFRRFTEEMGSWWPLETHSIGRDEAEDVTVESREGGAIVERTRSGQKHVWGTITEWSPPGRLAFTWHPGRDASTAQEVKVTFTAAGEGVTEVRLEHGGWDRFGDGAAEAREPYVPGWDLVLGRYSAGVGGLAGL